MVAVVALCATAAALSPGGYALGMLVVCAAFHVYYAAAGAVLLRYGTPVLGGVYPVNTLKWAEYAVSATLGTLAASGPPADDVVVGLLVAASVVQMAAGYGIDVGIGRPQLLVAAGFVLQAPLSWAVFAREPAVVYPYVYTAGYCAFGILCVLTLGSSSRDGPEVAYTWLSWTTKCAVAWSVGAPADLAPVGLVVVGWAVAIYAAG